MVASNLDQPSAAERSTTQSAPNTDGLTALKMAVPLRSGTLNYDAIRQMEPLRYGRPAGYDVTGNQVLILTGL